MENSDNVGDVSRENSCGSLIMYVDRNYMGDFHRISHNIPVEQIRRIAQTFGDLSDNVRKMESLLKEEYGENSILARLDLLYSGTLGAINDNINNILALITHLPYTTLGNVRDYSKSLEALTSIKEKKPDLIIIAYTGLARGYAIDKFQTKGPVDEVIVKSTDIGSDFEKVKKALGGLRKK